MNAPNPIHDPDQVDVDPYSVPLETIDVANPFLFAELPVILHPKR